jgi:hypothetical protein
VHLRLSVLPASNPKSEYGRMWRRWRGAPRSVQLLVAIEVAALGYGGLVHVVQLATGGWPPYGWAPAWLAAYFVSLTVFDPLAAWLLWAGRPAGLYLSAAVLATDAAANGYAGYGLSSATTADRVTQAVITALAVTALVMLPRVRRWMRPSTG